MSRGRHPFLARAIPPMLSTAPAALLIWYCLGMARLPYTSRFLILFGAILLLMYFLGEVINAISESLQEGLVRSWGGPPATLLLRHDSRDCDSDTRDLIYARIRSDFGIYLLSDDKSSRNPRQAEMLIDHAVRRIVGAQCRRPGNMLARSRDEFGFASALTAAVYVSLAFSVLLLGVSSYFLFDGATGATVPVFMLASGFVFVASFMAAYYLPRHLRTKAFGSARTLYSEYLRGSL